MKKIVLLHSDVSPDAGEDELDCLIQVQTVAGSLAALGLEPLTMPFMMDLNATLAGLCAQKPDIVFNLVETVAGKGAMAYFAPALLDFLRLPYTGSPTQAMFLTSNKSLCKKMLYANGISTPAWITADGTITGGAPQGVYIMKPSWEDASVGLDEASVLSSVRADTILRALQNRQEELGMECFAEAYIDGREFNVALLASGGDVLVLPPAEILFVDYPQDKMKILDYRAKWVEGSFEYENTVRNLNLDPHDAGLVTLLRDTALQCWRLLGLRGYARVDFRVDQEGRPWVLEINANPCLSPDAGFAAALDHAGITYNRAINDILRDAVNFKG